MECFTYLAWKNVFVCLPSRSFDLMNHPILFDLKNENKTLLAWDRQPAVDHTLTKAVSSRQKSICKPPNVHQLLSVPEHLKMGLQFYS